MAKLFIKAKDLEEYDSVRVFNERGKEVYYTKDEFRDLCGIYLQEDELNE